jgi:hypothetical protein
VLPDEEPSEKGTLVWPGLQGAVNWYSPSYSPGTGLFYVAAREMGSIYYKISFLVDGKQHVALAMGQALFVFALP